MRAAELQGAGDMVGAGGHGAFGQQEEPFLGGCQRRLGIGGAAGRRRLGLGAELAQVADLIGEDGMFVEGAQAEFTAEGLADAAGGAGGGEAVAAQFEEVVVVADPVEPEDLAPDFLQQIGLPAGQGAERADGLMARGRQGGGVQLAALGQRPLGDGDKGLGHHVGGQLTQ